MKSVTLTSAQEAQVKKGICPECGEDLLLEVAMEISKNALYQYDQEDGKWNAFDVDIDHTPIGIGCGSCGFNCDTDVIDDALVSKIDCCD